MGGLFADLPFPVEYMFMWHSASTVKDIGWSVQAIFSSSFINIYLYYSLYIYIYIYYKYIFQLGNCRPTSQDFYRRKWITSFDVCDSGNVSSKRFVAKGSKAIFSTSKGKAKCCPVLCLFSWLFLTEKPQLAAWFISITLELTSLLTDCTLRENYNSLHIQNVQSQYRACYDTSRMELHRGKLTWPWKTNDLQIYLLLKEKSS